MRTMLDALSCIITSSSVFMWRMFDASLFH